MKICIFSDANRRQILGNCVQVEAMPDHYLTEIGKDIDDYTNLILIYIDD